MGPYAMRCRRGAGATHDRLADRRRGHRQVEVLLQPVPALGLQEDDRVIERNRRAQERVRIAGRPRGDDGEPCRVRVVRLGALRVVLHGADAAAVGDANHHRQTDSAARPVAVLRDMADHLVERRVGEAVELHLHHRTEPIQRHTERGPGDARLRHRCVEAAVRTHLLLETVRDAEHTAQPADVLAVDDHRVVLAHRVAKGRIERPGHGHFHQRSSPARNSCSSCARWASSCGVRVA